MSMSTDLRVKVGKEYSNLYTDWKNLVCLEMHELFFLCACLGYNAQKNIPLDKKGESKFWSGTITPEEWSCFYAMLLKKNQMNPTSVMHDKKVMSEIEGYANGGMEILVDELLTDFTIGAPDNLRIDSSSSKGLAKSILAYISETAQ
jgi:hypothetical protein